MTEPITAPKVDNKTSGIVEPVSQSGDRRMSKRDETPEEVEARMLQNTKRLGEIMERASAHNKDIPSEVLDAAINQAIEEVRAEERRKRATA